MVLSRQILIRKDHMCMCVCVFSKFSWLIKIGKKIVSYLNCLQYRRPRGTIPGLGRFPGEGNLLH